MLIIERKGEKKDARNFTIASKMSWPHYFKWPTDHKFEKCILLFVKIINSMSWQAFGKDNSVSFSQYSLKKDCM